MPIINAECLRLGLGLLLAVRVQDTMRIVKTKGFKKGQDNLSELLNLADRKLSLSWQGWEDAYAEPGWPTVRERCVSDVRQHMRLREAMLQAGWSRGSVTWRP